MADHSGIFNQLRKLADPIHAERSALDVFSVHESRIFDSNQDAGGAALKQNSNKPTYINTTKNSPSKLPAKGKTGQVKFKSGKPHVTTYFSGGYRQFKEQIGRPKLELFGDMRKGYIPGVLSGNPVYGFIDKAQGDKAEGNETNYGTTIFNLTSQEIDLFIRLLNDKSL